MKMCLRKIFIPISLFLLTSTLYAQAPFNEKYRPRYHFTPDKNWINDPNGLIYYNGEYHLFFQYNPYGNQWGHMSWGHAVSPDLIHWKELSVAIPEEGNMGIFSGSAVMDPFFTSGFGKEKGKVPMVAIYTADVPNTNQSQHIAYSLDSGRTFTKFAGNPVLDLGKKDFRDPKVFWHQPSQKWVMLVMWPHEKKVQFYNSKSLKAWTLMSEFGPAGDTSGIWECPDLFRVPVEGLPGKYKWVFMMSPSPYMQYFVGEFDGTRFINESDSTAVFRPDYGPDYYAAITYNNLPSNFAPVSMGWVNNWNYAGDIPAGQWRGAMSIPRKLSVRKIGTNWILLQNPVDELSSLHKKDSILPSDQLIHLTDAGFMAEWVWKTQTGTKELSLGDKEFIVRFDPEKREISVDRSQSRGFSNAAYKKRSQYKAVFPGEWTETLRFRLFVDESIVELFVGNGEQIFTTQVFSEKPLNTLQFNGSAESFPVMVRDLGGYRD
jgi:fructan beta-fructosidase